MGRTGAMQWREGGGVSEVLSIQKRGGGALCHAEGGGAPEVLESAIGRGE